MTAQNTDLAQESGPKGDNPLFHFIRGGKFVCTAPASAACRNYPSCGCEAWGVDLHGDPPATGHEDQPQDQCWIQPWLDATDLRDSYHPEELNLEDAQFPDGAVTIEWDYDSVLWSYADPDVEPAR